MDPRHSSSCQIMIQAEINFQFLDEVIALVVQQKEFLQAMADTVNRYLDQCGRRWVNLDSLFSFMNI